MEIETESTVYTFAGQSAAVLEAALPLLDGSHTLGGIAASKEVSSDELAAILATLNQDEPLVLDSAAIEAATSSRDLMDALQNECAFWSKETFSKPFWRKVLSGTASRQVILGWGVEFYHFVDAANTYMAAGTANCREDVVVREWLARHYIEECDHGRIFLEGLGLCGLDIEQIIAAPPLPTTRALIDYLYELALANSFGYAAAFAVMQPSREQAQRAQVEVFYDRLRASYPFASGMFDAFRRHALIDVELEHNQIALERMAERMPARTLHYAPDIANAARGLVEQFALFFEGIDDYYSRPRSSVPRRPLSSLALV